MSFASLSSGLLARKGQARPAMRPQGFDQISGPAQVQDDLGWNDMGHDRALAAPTAPIAPAPTAQAQEPSSTLATPPSPASAPAQEPAPLPKPETELELSAAPAQPEKTGMGEVVRLPIVRAAPGSKGKSAFTLRLDPVRHLRLRLACALRHRSAQTVVTEALDLFLSSPELDALAEQAKRSGSDGSVSE